MNILEKYPEIKNNPLFGNSEDECILKYVNETSVRVADFSPGEDICAQKSCSVSPALLLRGTAYVNASEGSKSLLLRTASAGALFGIATLYSAKAEFPTRISAKTNCTVIFIAPDALRSFIENDLSATKAFLSMMGDKIVYLNQKISTLSAGSAEKKLCLFLTENETDGEYTAKTSLSSLADMLGIGRASLYRAFDKLENEGFIKRDDKTIFLLSKEAMTKKYFGSVSSQEQNI